MLPNCANTAAPPRRGSRRQPTGRSLLPPTERRRCART